MCHYCSNGTRRPSATDNALSPREAHEMPADATLVGWQCGYEPLFVAVWSYLGGVVPEDEAEAIAADYLEEIGWFTDGPEPADYVLLPEA